ncbi:transposase [Caballeronia concitans]|uniref:Transposase n=1 Tax=Caballeronia concitans TaxID=1777133 RepID=A0A658R5E3_9BURK|nr:transposase [Caballeronia concitans]
MNDVTLVGIDLGKHSFHLHGQDRHGCRFPQKTTAQTAHAFLQQFSTLHRCHGSMRRSPLHRPQAVRLRTPGQTDFATLCETVCEGKQERLHRRRSRLRSCISTIKALCHSQMRPNKRYPVCTASDTPWPNSAKQQSIRFTGFCRNSVSASRSAERRLRASPALSFNIRCRCGSRIYFNAYLLILSIWTSKCSLSRRNSVSNWPTMSVGSGC